MAITVKFFAGLREALELTNLELPAEDIRDAMDVWVRATGNKPMPDNTLCAVNLNQIELDHPVRDGDEVAFFPPVTGG